MSVVFLLCCVGRCFLLGFTLVVAFPYVYVLGIVLGLVFLLRGCLGVVFHYDLVLGVVLAVVFA